MKLTLHDGLLFVPITVAHAGETLVIPKVVLDTGSASTLFSTDYLARIGVTPQPHDVLYTVRGVGGTEVVFLRRLERVQVGAYALSDFDVEVGAVSYGFAINGILGTDFLLRANAVIDLHALTLTFHEL